MAPGESDGYPRSHQAHIDPKSSKQHKRKKSKKKAKRDNQRAALFQKRKQEELSAAAAATGTAPSSSTSTPNKEFEFSEPICENMSRLENTSTIINLDGNATLQGDKEEREPVNSLHYNDKENTSTIINLDGNATLQGDKEEGESCQGIKEEKEEKDANETSSEHEDDSCLQESESEPEPDTDLEAVDSGDEDIEALTHLQAIFSTLTKKRVPAKATAALEDFKSDILLIAKEIEKISNTGFRFRAKREAYEQLKARRAILLIGNCRSKKEKDDLWKVDFSVISGNNSNVASSSRGFRD